jgi:hypothetical protein
LITSDHLIITPAPGSLRPRSCLRLDRFHSTPDQVTGQVSEIIDRIDVRARVRDAESVYLQYIDKDLTKDWKKCKMCPSNIHSGW